MCRTQICIGVHCFLEGQGCEVVHSIKLVMGKGDGNRVDGMNRCRLYPEQQM